MFFFFQQLLNGFECPLELGERSVWFGNLELSDILELKLNRMRDPSKIFVAVFYFGIVNEHNVPDMEDVSNQSDAPLIERIASDNVSVYIDQDSDKQW